MQQGSGCSCTSLGFFVGFLSLSLCLFLWCFNVFFIYVPRYTLYISRDAIGVHLRECYRNTSNIRCPVYINCSLELPKQMLMVAFGVVAMRPMWTSTYIEGVPQDPSEDQQPRQVHQACYSKVKPTKMPQPKMLLWNDELAQELGFENNAEVWSGNVQIEGMVPFAHCYGGHQFGTWAGQLGDGRAISLGTLRVDHALLEVQLKGSGITPYSRRGDGRAVLRSSLREFLCSEAMFHLGIPTSRALSLVSTGEQVVRDLLYDGHPAEEQGAIVTRIAQSFLRFGSFEIHASRNDQETLRQLLDYVLLHFHKREYDFNTDCLNWLRHVGQETARLVCEWMRVGFVHGVMNTDNMSIHSVTIDYGPYGWVEPYELDWTPNTTDKFSKRYTYGNQPMIAMWNYARLLDSILPSFSMENEKRPLLESFQKAFQTEQHRMWCNKLGIKELTEESIVVIEECQQLLQESKLDMTIFFRELSIHSQTSIEFIHDAAYQPIQRIDAWMEWFNKWNALTNNRPDKELMLASNPKYVLRNWLAFEAIERAEQGDFSYAMELYDCLKNPYEEQDHYSKKFYQKRPEWAEHKPGCSMLSCSS